MIDKMNFTSKTKRVVALALVVVLCLAMVPIASFAHEEVTVCPYCNQKLNGKYDCTLVKDGYYTDELECDEHFPKSECDACAEFDALQGMLCDEEFDIIEVEVDGDDGVEYETTEIAHEHGPDCYVECDGNCDGGHICVVDCSQEHEEHSEECYLWVDAVCEHSEILPEPQNDEDIDEDIDEDLEDDVLPAEAIVPAGKTMTFSTGIDQIEEGITYIVTFEDIYGNVLKTVNVSERSVISEDEIPALDLSPKHWYIKGAEDPAAEVFAFGDEVTEHITLHPYYSNEVSITYMVEGDKYLVQTLAANGSATEPLPPTIPSGYLSFLGWYDDSTGELFDFTAPVTKSVVLEARFSDQYLIKFKNHEDIVVYTMLVSPNSQVIYPANPEEIGTALEISNGSFKYWYDETSTAPSDGIFVSGTYATKNLTLKPYYSNEYLLIFISEGTQVEAEAVTVNTATVAPQAPTRAGYTFDKWVYYDTGEAFVFGNTISKDTMLRATWTPNQTYYTIIYWCEKADIDGDPGEDSTNYSFYKSVTKTALSGTAVSSLNIGAGTLDTIPWFSYRHQACATNTVLGNGLTVVNVYFKRIVYTYYFNLNPGTSSTNARYGATMTFNGTTYAQGVDPDGNNYVNKQYSFEAKYEQDIENVWPSSWNATFAKTSRSRTTSTANWGTVSTTKLTSWGYPSNINATSNFVTKRFTVTEDMLPKSGTSVTFTAVWGAVTTRQVNYWFEKLLSESTEGAQSRTFTGVTARYYVMSSYYSQNVDISGSLSAKEYTGMVKAGEANISSGGTVTTYNFYYTRNRYALSFDTRGGDTVILNAEYDYSKVMYGEALSLYEPENPTKTGENGVQYNFLGWYYDTDYNIPVDFSKDTMPNSNLTLFARWESTEYTVGYYDGIGGTQLYSQGRAFGEYAYLNGISELQDYTIGSSVEGKGVFNGWLWKVSGIYTEYSFDMPVSRNIDLYASWFVDGFTVTYDTGEGTGTAPVDNDEYKYGVGTIVLNGSGLTKGDQVFIGWRVEGEGRIYYPYNILKITGNMRLVAVYASASDFISIIYHSNNGAYHTYHVNILRTDSEYETAGVIFSKTDSALKSWNTKDDGSGAAYGLRETLIIAGITGNLEGSTLNLYAQWEEAPRYRVTYVLSFAGGEPDDTAPFEAFITENSAAYRKNDTTVPFENELTYTDVIGTSDGVHGVFKFTGWTSEPKDVQINETSNTLTMPDRDVEFTANWTFTPTYAVTYQWAGAYAAAVEESYTLNQEDTRYAADADVTFLNNESYAEISNVISNGRNGKLVFTGWTGSKKDGDINVVFTDGLFKMPSEDVVFTGSWEFVPDVVTLVVTKRFEGITETNLIPSSFEIAISYKDAYGKDAEYWLSTTTATPLAGNNYIEYSWTIEDFPANTAFTVTETGEAIAGYTQSASASFLNAALTGSNSWQLDGIEVSKEEGLTNTFTIINTYKKYTVSYKWAEGTILPAGFNEASLPASEERAGGTRNIPVADGYNNIDVLSKNGELLAVWTFNGWVLDEASGVVITDGQFTMPNDNVVFKGSWTLENIADLGVTGYNGQYNGRSHTITVDENTLINGDILYYSLTGNDDDWSETLPTYTDVTRDANGNLAAISVYVKAVNKKLGTARTAYTTMNISQRSITLTADSERYPYDGSIREVTTYTLSGDGIVDTEVLSAEAYGGGRGRSGETVSYSTAIVGNVTVTKVSGESSTSNYNIKTAVGTLTIWDTTTTSPPPSESLPASESIPPSESLTPETPGESESLSTSEPPSESESSEPSESPAEIPPLETIRRPGTPDVYPEPAREGSTLIEWEDGILIEISEEGVPLGNWAYEQEEEVWIFEPEIPLGYTPVTGDSTNLTLAILLFIASFFALACVFVVKMTANRTIKR